MTTHEKIQAAIYAAIDSVNEELPENFRLDKSPDSVLYGEAGMLDSVDLVGLIVTVEQGVQERLGLLITLADERALSSTKNPFSTVASLCDYIILLLEEDISNKRRAG